MAVAEVKNYGLSGVHRTLQLGKQGPILVGNADTDSFTVTLQDAATLTTMGGANATDTAHFITKAQLDVVYTEAQFLANVNYNGTSPILLGNISSGTKTIITTFDVTTAFDANAVVTVGNSTNNNLLMSDDYAEIEVTGTYQTINTVEFASNTALNIYVTQGGATQGAGTILVSVVDGPVVNSGTINYGGGGGIALTDLSVTSNSPSGNGSLTYSNSTGVFTFTPANLSSVAGNYSDSNVVTLLSSFGSNTIFTSGNISAGYFVGNGSLLTGITAGTNYTNSNVVTLLSSFGSNTLVTTGNVSAGNVIATGTTSTGIAAITAGVTNTLLPNTIASFSANVNNYTQVTLQNKSSGADATADFVITANNGSDTVNFADFGIINSGYDNTTPTNSLGNIVFAADTYLYAQGNSSSVSQSGGNLAIGTTTIGKTVKVFAGGANSNSIVGTFSNTGLAVNGNVTANNFIGNISITGNVTGTSQNVSLVAGAYSTVFDNTGNTAFANGTVSLTTLSATGNVNANIVVSTNNGNGTNFKVGDDAWIGDVNTADTIRIQGQQNAANGYIVFGNADSTTKLGRAGAGALTYGGDFSVSGNITGNTAGFAIGYRDIPQVSFTGNATIATTDAGKHFYSTQSSNFTLTIANNASQGFQIGAAITVVNQGTGTITIAQGSGVTLYLAGNATASNRSVATFGMATIMKVATNTWFINGTGVS